MKSPFQYGTLVDKESFVNRVEERKQLKELLGSGINVMLISPRRWGKSSLVKVAMDELTQEDKHIRVCFIDAFSIKTEAEFYRIFAREVISCAASTLEKRLEDVKQFLKAVSPSITLKSDPTDTLSFDLKLELEEKSVMEILELPEKIAAAKGIHLIVCIDEFQQIAEFKDSKAFQKRLRSVWQLQKSVSYCLFGSKKHLMNELFEKKSLPFYKFGDTVYLPKIGTEDWVDYICGRFEATGKHISAELAGKICRAVDNHSSYVQQLAWLVWIHTDETATEQDFEGAYQDIIDQNTPLFEKQTESLTTYQMNFLRAMLDGVHSEFTTQEILQKYKLGSSANVSIVKRALVKKELIEIEKRKVIIPDPVMKVWLKKELGGV